MDASTNEFTNSSTPEPPFGDQPRAFGRPGRSPEAILNAVHTDARDVPDTAWWQVVARTVV